jgi:hypothetical protein
MMKKQNFEALIGQSKKTSLFFSREKPNWKIKSMVLLETRKLIKIQKFLWFFEILAQ